MAQINLPVTSRSSSDANQFSDVYGNDNAIVTQVNGNLDATNLADGAVTNAKVSASAAIAYSKLATLNTGQVVAGNAGTPTATTLAGAVTVGATGATSIAYHEDTQAANISATGVLTGISITPGAGTYLAFATALVESDADTVVPRIRVNGVNVITGPTVASSGIDSVPMTVMGVITPSAGQAVEVHATITGTPTVTGGRLVLVRLA